MPTPDQKHAADLSQQVSALAEQLGRIAGTIEGTAESWMKREQLTEQLARVRDGANQVLEGLTSGIAKGRRAVGGLRLVGRKSKRGKKKNASAASARKADRAHAPGKRRRKPAPSMKGGKKSDERIPKMRTAVAARQRRKSYA